MKFFVTHGQGIEPFVHNELVSAKFTKLFNVDISKESNFHGKVIFSAEAKRPITVTVPSSNSKYSSDMLTKVKVETSDGEDGNSSTNDNVDDGLENCVEGITSIAKHFISNLQTVERIFGLLFQDHNDDVSIAVGVDVGAGAGRSLHRRDALSNLHNYISKMSIKCKLSQLLDDLYELQVANEHKHEEHVVSQECKRRKKSRSFRVNAKVSGKWKRILNPSSVAPCIGSALVKSLSNSDDPAGGPPWEVNLRNPTLEISVYLTDDGILSGVSLENIPLSNRSYLNKIPLRSTVAYCMGSLAVENTSREGKEGETFDPETETGPPSLIVLDPMCGSSVILIELVKYFPQVMAAFGIDNDPLQLEEAAQNIKKSSEAELSARLFIILGDSTKKVFPFRDNLVFDAVVCDLPFGIQHSYTSPSARGGSRDDSLSDDGNILPSVLSNIDKVVKHEGNIIILISLQMNFLIEDILSRNKLCWTLKRKYPLKLGELPALICHYKK